MKLVEQLEDFGNRIISLINAHLQYYKIAAYEQVMSVMSVLLSKIIILLTILISSVFFSIWFAFFLGELIGKLSLGFLITGAIYLIAGFIVHANRDKWFIDPMVKELGKIIEKQEDDNEAA